MQNGSYVALMSVLWRRYNMGAFAGIFLSILLLILLRSDFLEVRMGLQTSLPLTSELFPTVGLKLSGWRVLGLFAVMPILTAVFQFLWPRHRGVRWFALSVLVASVLYVLNLEVIEVAFAGKMPEYFSVEGIYLWPLWSYFGLLSMQTLIVLLEGLFEVQG